MNIIDIVIIIIMAYCVIRGLMLGLLNSISSFIAIILSILLSRKYYPVLSDSLKSVSFTDMHGVVSYILLFIFFFIGIKIIFFLVKQLSSSSGLTAIDRSFGIILGFCKGILISGILLTVIQVSMPPKSIIITKSVLLPYYNEVMTISGFVPDDFIKYLK